MKNILASLFFVKTTYVILSVCGYFVTILVVNLDNYMNTQLLSSLENVGDFNIMVKSLGNCCYTLTILPLYKKSFDYM